MVLQEVKTADPIFNPVLAELTSSGVDMRDLMPSDLRPDRSGILWARYSNLWLSLNNSGGRSEIKLLDENQVRIEGDYNYNHFGNKGNGKFSYHAQIGPNSTCKVGIQITGTLSFNLQEQGHYTANVPNDYIEYVLGSDKTVRITQQGYQADWRWYPNIELKFTTKDQFFHLVWENRPA